MGMTYEKMKKFMQDYYADFNRYANDAGTIHKMNEYWTPNVKVVTYFQLSGGKAPITFSTRKEFQDFLNSTHSGMKNSLNPLDIVIDEKMKKVVILTKLISTNVKTGDETEIFGMSCYQLIVDDGGKFKIDSLDLIYDAPDKITKKTNEGDSFIYAF